MDYDGPPRDEVVEKNTYANYVSRATKVFAIHMAALIVVSILIGIFWCIEGMWVIGGSVGFFMTAWHAIAIDKAITKQHLEEKEEQYYE